MISFSTARFFGTLDGGAVSRTWRFFGTLEVGTLARTTFFSGTLPFGDKLEDAVLAWLELERDTTVFLASGNAFLFASAVGNLWIVSAPGPLPFPLFRFSARFL